MSAAEPTRATAPDARIPMVCCDCHRGFLALAEWQIRCRSCYHALKAGREIPAPAVEVERLRAENAALRQELAQARSEVARWRRIAHAAQAAPGNARRGPRRARPRSRPSSGVGSCSVAIRTATAAVYRPSKPPVGCWSIGHEQP